MASSGMRLGRAIIVQTLLVQALVGPRLQPDMQRRHSSDYNLWRPGPHPLNFATDGIPPPARLDAIRTLTSALTAGILQGH